jgi:glucose/arabinose dehydrogenase
MAKKTFLYAAGFLAILALLVLLGPHSPVTAQQEDGPILLDPTLDVRLFLEGLITPTGIAFLGEDELFVIEKNTGQVKHVIGGAVQGTPLDLAVNFSSERGLLGITLDPDFSNNGYVYLYWTCSAPPPTGTPFFPSEIECADEPQLGADTEDLLAVPLFGNRVDRFVWDGASLTWDLNLVKLRVFQNDGAPIPRGQGDEEQAVLGNHDGGVITFGTDGKLYVIIGDVGRRGALQNLPFGPISYPPSDDRAGTQPAVPTEQSDEPADQFGGPLAPNVPLPRQQTVPDDQFGGPFPDDAHFTGVILRLNNDGSIPTDNPFYEVGAETGGEIGENIQMTFAYGIRNSFGMDVDPLTGNVWTSENGEDAFDELNLVFPGQNSGWIQIQGPASRIAEYKTIETTEAHNEPFPNLQQFRWPPENIADSSQEAMRRLFRIPGSRFSNPEFSWKYAVAPAAIGFVKSQALGDDFHGDLFMGFSEPEPLEGPLLHFDLTSNRSRIRVNNPGVQDRVADNQAPHDLTESESFLIGTRFGLITDIETGPNGNLFVVSFIDGIIYEIFQRAEPLPVAFTATLTGAAEVPGPGDEDGSGTAFVLVDQAESEVCFAILVSNITLPAAAAHIHVGEAGVAGDVVVALAPPDEHGASTGCVSGVDPALIEAILQDPAGYYVNVHTTDFPAGAVRGQLTD